MKENEILHTKEGDFIISQLIRTTLCGELYEAKWIKNDETVALKISKTIPFANVYENPVKEADILQKLAEKSQDNGIVRLYTNFEGQYLFPDSEVAADAIFQVMEYLPGLTVLDFVNQEILDRRYDTNEFVFSAERLDVVRQMFDIVSFLHKNKYVHLDFTLENLMFTENNRVTAIDFGLAQYCPDSWLVGIYSGKRIYLPPETYSNKTLYDGRKRDIWSLGVCLYTLYSGNYFISGTDNLRIICTQLKTGFSSYLQSHYPLGLTWPKPLLDLIERCLFINPEKRPTIEQLLKHEWVQGKQNKSFKFISLISTAVRKTLGSMLPNKTQLYLDSPKHVRTVEEEKEEEKCEPLPVPIIPKIRRESVETSSPATQQFIRSMAQENGITVRNSPSEVPRVMKFVKNLSK